MWPPSSPTVRIACADQLVPVGEQVCDRAQPVATGQVEDGVDAVGQQLPDPVGDAVAVGHQRRAERFDECRLVLARRADDVDVQHPGRSGLRRRRLHRRRR